ncbi:hypothetical protein [Saccharopolyspora shandongensis]|uniref:hypothetical protein n=1 Tax=Saccharopolyspora shandongensis TaxID=418495 RepID=UPI0033D6B863
MVAAVHGGMTQAGAVRVFAVAPQSVSRWVQAWRKRGSKVSWNKPLYYIQVLSVDRLD